jgi:Na+/melibiose symporter-like transporter
VKLNNRRTILVGLAFLSICTFWQMYDSVMTLILTDTFKLNETFAGAIMAADNVLALFLLPFFGALSDKTSTRIGRRMPFIVGGTALAAILMNLIPLLDDRYAANPGTGTLVLFIIVLGLLLVSMGTYRSPAVALMPDVTPMMHPSFLCKMAKYTCCTVFRAKFIHFSKGVNSCAKTRAIFVRFLFRYLQFASFFLVVVLLS